MGLSQMKPIFLAFLTSLAIHGFSQSGPAGVGTTDGTSSLSVWYDANQGVVETSGAVTQWNDQSGYDNHATPPAVGNRPALVTAAVNGYPTITFDGSDDYLTAPDDASLDLTTWSIIIVGIINTHKNYNAFMVKGADAQENYEFLTNFPGTGNIHYPVRHTSGGRSTDSESGEVFSTSTYEVHQLDYDQSNFEYFINGNQTETDAETRTPQTNSNTLYIGNEQSTSGRNLDGSIAEAIIYASPINSAERLILHNAMAAKYGFTLNANDFYNEDNSGAGNYDHDVAGIGRVDASNLITDAQGTGIVRIIKTGGGLGNDEFLMWGHDNGALAATNTTDIPSGVQARLERVWRVSEVNSSGSGINVGVVDMRFDLTGLGSVSASDLRLLIDTDNDGIFSDQTPFSGATSLGGNIYEFASIPGGATGIRNNRRFTLATANTSTTPLPVELRKFGVESQENVVAISWSTASETDNDFFTVQRSQDAQEFVDLFHISGAGNSNEVLHYDTVDQQPLAGQSFYRLKQTDFDGTYSFSPIKTVFRNIANTRFAVFPNPASGSVMIRSESDKFGETKFILVDTKGRIHLDIKVSFDPGTQINQLDLPNLPSGVYFGRFQGVNQTTIPILINR